MEDDPLAELRAKFLAGLTHDEPEEDRVQADHSVLTTEQWHRAQYERTRYERGELTDWPNVVDLTEQERAVLESLGDSLLRLFRQT